MPISPCGVLATVTETTAQVINERALETLRKTSSYLIGCRSEQEVLEKAAQAISENKSDFPFVQLYSIVNFPQDGPVRQALESKEPLVYAWIDGTENGKYKKIDYRMKKVQ